MAFCGMVQIGLAVTEQSCRYRADVTHTHRAYQEKDVWDASVCANHTADAFGF